MFSGGRRLSDLDLQGLLHFFELRLDLCAEQRDLLYAILRFGASQGALQFICQFNTEITRNEGNVEVQTLLLVF